MSVLAKKWFYDEAAAFEHVESILWPEGPVCPKCGNCDKHYKLTGVRSKPSNKNPEGIERHGLYKCAECRSQFTVRIGTIFEESKLPLHIWLQAIHLIASSKKGISSNQLHRTLEITLKSAWFLSHRIREAMRTDDLPPMGGDGKTVEVDETYYGRLHDVPVQGGGTAHKMPILTLVERGVRAKSFPITSASLGQIRPIVRANVARETALMTDTWSAYPAVGREFASHEMVNHRAKEYVRGDAHTNTIEGFFSIFKRGMRGFYQHCAEHHLHRYLAEFDFRYSNRVRLGVDDVERATRTLMGFKGRRLTYRRPVEI
jgi:transposase-like protein